MTVGGQMPELDWGAFPPPYKIGCQNTPYKLGLKAKVFYLTSRIIGGGGGGGSFC